MSAVCVTGLTVVSTAVHWSFFGQLVILVGIFVGGLGTLTLASLLALMVSKKLGVRGKLIAQEAMNNAGRLGEVGTLLRIVIVTSVVIEAVLAAGPDSAVPRRWAKASGQSVWHGVFYAISAFNNAGFTPHSDGIVPYETDLWILIPLMVGVFLGSLGFPVVMVLQQNGLNWKKWNLHTKLTIQVSLILLAAGTVLWGLMEWENMRTIGGMNLGDKITHSLFASVMTRSGGFNLVDQNQMDSTTMLLTDALMFAGGGSASTAGGIKVTTIAVMFLAIVAEARGDADVKIYGRTIPQGTMRVAISVIVAGATLVAVSAPAAPADQRRLPGPGAVRNDFRLRHRGPEHQPQCRAAAGGRLRPHRPDVRRPRRHRHPRRWAGPAPAQPAVPLPGRETDHWLVPQAPSTAPPTTRPCW